MNYAQRQRIRHAASHMAYLNGKERKFISDMQQLAAKKPFLVISPGQHAWLKSIELKLVMAGADIELTQDVEQLQVGT